MKIELIYFRGCPHTEQARANIRQALESIGVDSAVEEWDRDDPDAPAYVRGYSSPTILVDGRDVTGEGTLAGGASCRAGGAPSVDQIRAAIAAT